MTQGARSQKSRCFLIQWKSKSWNLKDSIGKKYICTQVITHQISWPICDCIFACPQFVFIFATFATLFSHPYAPFVFIWTGAQDHQTTFIAQVLLFFFFIFATVFWILYSYINIISIFSALFLEISNIQDGTAKLETLFDDILQLPRNISLVVISW